MDAQGLIRQGSELLAGAGVSEAPREAELLLCHAAGLDRVTLYRDNPEIPAQANELYDSFIKRRMAREPMHYITRGLEFLGLRLRVGPGVLIPRPETEILVGEALRILALKPIWMPRVLDMCTGSGCIALAMARARPDADITASDESAAALGYAKESARDNNIHNVRFIEGHMFAPLEGMRFEMILSNPPYIPAGEIDGLEPEVSQWEPREALDGGADGLDFYREILTAAPCYLETPGAVVLELGAGQADQVAEIARSAGGFGSPAIIRDLAGHERVAVFLMI